MREVAWAAAPFSNPFLAQVIGVLAGLVFNFTLSRTLVFTGARVNSFSSLDEAVVLPDCHVGRNAQLSRVVIDRGVKVAEGTADQPLFEFDIQPGLAAGIEYLDRLGGNFRADTVARQNENSMTHDRSLC